MKERPERTPTGTSAPSEHQERLDAVIAEYLEAVETGQEPDRKRLINEHPELADELREFFADRDRMHRMAGPVRDLAERAIRIRCPHCGNRVQLIRPQLPEATCANCGSTFRIEPGSTAAYRPAKLPAAIDRFEVQEFLGRGSFGTVYKAHDPKFDVPVAVKVPHTGYFSTPEETARLLREARMARRLKHPSIVQVHETVHVDGVPHLVCDYVEGLTLEDVLSGGLPNFHESAELVARIADALAYAHREGVLHRDIKPGNILIDAAGRPHLTDFGLARRDDGEITVTLDGQVLGTPAYMSPEQAAGDHKHVDPRSDVYSLGVVLFELLTAELPFRGNRRMLLHQVLHDDPRPPRNLNDHVPRDLDTISLKAMAKEPARRYQSARELAEDLQRWLNAEPILARPIGSAARAWRWCRRKPSLAALITSTALLLVTVSLVTAAAYLRESHLHAIADDLRGRAEVGERDAQRAQGRAVATSRRLSKSLEDLKTKQTRIASLVGTVDDLEKDRLSLEGDLADRQRELYRTLVTLARAERDAGNLNKADQYLEECPSPMRSWDWYYYKRACNPPVIRLPEGTIVALSQDGRLLASYPVGEQKLVLRELPTGRLVQTLPVAKPDLTALAISPDSTRVATATSEGTISLWKVRSDQIDRVSTGLGAITAISFSPYGEFLAAAGAEHVAVWRLPALSHEFTSPAYLASDVRVDGKRLVAMAPNARQVRVWDWTTGSEIVTHQAPWSGTVDQVVLSPDVNRVAVCQRNAANRRQEHLFIWNLESRTFHRLRPLHPSRANEITALVFSGNSQPLVASMRMRRADNPYMVDAQSAGNHELGVWDLAADAIVYHDCGPRARVTSLALPQQGRWLAAADNVGIRLFDLMGVTTLPGVKDFVYAVQFGPDGRYLALGLGRGGVELWDLANGVRRLRLATDGAVTGLTISADGKRLAVACLREVKAWHLPSGEELLSERTEAGAVAFSPDGNLLAWRSKTGTTVWDFDKAGEYRRFEGNGYGIAFSPDGKRLYTSGTDGLVAWDLSTGERVFRSAVASRPFRLALSPDGRHVALAAGSHPGYVHLFDATTGEETAKWQDGPSGYCLDVAYSSDGKLIATASHMSVRVYDARTGSQVTELRGTQPFDGNVRNRSYAVAFSKDGRRLAAGWGEEPSNVLIWDASLGKKSLANQWFTKQK